MINFLKENIIINFQQFQNNLNKKFQKLDHEIMIY